MSWSREEISRLCKYYLIMSSDQLVKEFAPRPLKQIQNKASKLKIARKKMGYNWRKICNEHKPTIILTQVVPREK